MDYIGLNNILLEIQGDTTNDETIVVWSVCLSNNRWDDSFFWPCSVARVEKPPDLMLLSF